MSRSGGRGVLRESAREIVVVVLSILIAFALDAWWDESVERGREKELLAALLAEFEANREPLELRIDNHRRLGTGQDELADLLDASSAPSVTVPDSLLITLLITPTFDPTLGALEEAQSSGLTSLIRNPELRRRLRGWRGRWQDVREEEQLNLRLVQDELYPALASHTSLNALMGLGGPWMAGQRTDGLRSGSTTVPVTPALINFARQRAIRSGRAARELADLRAELDSIVTSLGQEVGG
ncbi:MAG: hypothetical protein R3195_17475 [Gemmatimonadota bacterium]|nr:hypothetical protein [Gemmatimonadota bacterium]